MRFSQSQYPAGSLLAPRKLYQLPSDTQVVGYLLQSVNWYRHVYTEQQVANDPGDLIFLNDNQAIERQIVKLSFEFAKADAALERPPPLRTMRPHWQMPRLPTLRTLSS